VGRTDRHNEADSRFSPLVYPGGVFLEEVSRSRKRDILLGTWNVRSLYRAADGSSGIGRGQRLDGVGSG